jgi:hypothetical protein
MLQPEPPPPTHAHPHGIRSFLRWLVLSFLGLTVCCGLAASLLGGIERLFSIDTRQVPSRTLELVSLILFSSIAGVVVAVVVGSSWQPPLYVVNRRWLGVNVLGMSVGIGIGLMTYNWMILSTFPVALWLLIMATIGLLFGCGQWFICHDRCGERRRIPIRKHRQSVPLFCRASWYAGYSYAGRRPGGAGFEHTAHRHSSEEHRTQGFGFEPLGQVARRLRAGAQHGLPDGLARHHVGLCRALRAESVARRIHAARAGVGRHVPLRIHHRHLSDGLSWVFRQQLRQRIRRAHAPCISASPRGP